MSDERKCPLGDDCDLTVAWMAGAEKQREHMESRIKEMADALDAAEARVRELEAQLALPGDMHWYAPDPEQPLECWDDPIVERWEAAGTVFEIMCAKEMPRIFVTESVLTVDEHGDPDETTAVWFATADEARGHFGRSLAEARARAALDREGEG